MFLELRKAGFVGGSSLHNVVQLCNIFLIKDKNEVSSNLSQKKVDENFAGN